MVLLFRSTVMIKENEGGTMQPPLPNEGGSIQSPLTNEGGIMQLPLSSKGFRENRKRIKDREHQRIKGKAVLLKDDDIILKKKRKHQRLFWGKLDNIITNIFDEGPFPVENTDLADSADKI
ncbi:hypothetical protein BgiBS90_023748 [Biomphalaria glabrata]|nr:hypothetical protein BgiBS90_023748 [Biomphalaria glabrata]